MKIDNRYCQPCDISSKHIQHWEEDGHKINVILQKFQENCQEMPIKSTIQSTDKNIDIHDNTVTVKLGVNEEKIIPLKFKANNKDLEIKNIGTPCNCDVTEIKIANVTEEHKNIKIVTIENSDEETENKSLANTTINVKCFGKHVGKIIVPIVIICKNNNHEEIRIIFQVDIITESEESISLKPETKYIKNKKHRCWKGNRVSSNRKALIKNKIDQLEIEKKLETFKQNEELTPEKLSIDSQNKLKTELNDTNYEEKFNLLLNLEYHQNVSILEKTDLENVKVTIKDNLTFILEVPNLNNGNNKLNTGDTVMMSEKNDDWEQKFEATVTETLDTHTCLKTDNQQLLEKLKTQQIWDIHFMMYSWGYSMMSRALKIASRTNLTKRLFPTTSTTAVTAKAENAPPSIFLNQQVADNPQQRVAVESMLMQASGTAPVIIIFLISAIIVYIYKLAFRLCVYVCVSYRKYANQI